jgi:hypothetical protein
MNFSVEISDQTVSTLINITHSSDQLPRLLTDHQLRREGGSLDECKLSQISGQTIVEVGL